MQPSIWPAAMVRGKVISAENFNAADGLHHFTQFMCQPRWTLWQAQHRCGLFDRRIKTQFLTWFWNSPRCVIRIHTPWPKCSKKEHQRSRVKRPDRPRSAATSVS